MKRIKCISPLSGLTKSLSIAIVLFLSSYLCFSQEKEHGINIGLVYPLSTHGTRAGEYTNFFSLNAIGGVSREEKGFTAAGVFNVIHGNAAGFQVAGFSNFIGGFAGGFKASGFMNTYGSARGFQGAGFANFSKANITGMQAAGFMNKVQNIHGFQAAGFMNMAADVNGTQAAGYINIANDVEGSQLAGFINIAGRVKGVQISGFINIADSSDYAIGIINIIKNGEKWIGLTTDDNLTTVIAFRSGGRKMYGIIGLGYNFQNSKQVFARQFGLGAHLITMNNFRLNTEASVTSLESFRRGEFGKFSLSLMPSLKLGSKLELFGGPALNFINTNTEEGRKLINRFMWNDINSRNRLNGLYIGYSAGIHMSL